MHFEIATPEKVIYKAEIDKLSVDTEMGQITILPGHIPLVASLVPGEMTIVSGSKSEPYAVTGGFIEVRAGDKVVILADAAEHVREIDEKRAKEASERAKKAMEGLHVDDVKFAEASAALERSLSRLRIARKHSHIRRTSQNFSEGQ